MSNNLLTISKITNEALMVLENELTFSSEVNREYDDQFAVVGAKIGNTLNVRRPGRFIGTTGPAKPAFLSLCRPSSTLTPSSPRKIWHCRSICLATAS
jgi:hypothetical protein